MRSARWEARTAMKRVRPTPVGERKKHVRKLDAPAPSRRQLTMTAGGRKVLDASSCGVSAEAAAYAVRTAVLPALSAFRFPLASDAASADLRQLFQPQNFDYTKYTHDNH